MRQGLKGSLPNRAAWRVCHPERSRGFCTRQEARGKLEKSPISPCPTLFCVPAFSFRLPNPVIMVA
jgi:hypothetical protein